MIYAKLIAVGLLVTGAVFLTWNYLYTINENKRLTVEIRAANSSIEKLDDKSRGEDLITKNEDIILKGVRNAPKSENGVIIDSAIDDIDRLHKSRGDKF